MKTFILLIGLMLGSSVNALEPLNDQALEAVQGQAGADLSLKLSLNQIYNSTTGKYEFDNGQGGVCEKPEFCRLGLAVNKRFVNNGSTAISDPTQSAPANKLWLVFKGIQGTIDIQRLGLDGADLIYKNKSNKDQVKPAIQFGFSAAQPIRIRNFGFNALSIEQDNFTSYLDANGRVVENSTDATAAGDYAYLKTATYNETNAPNSKYDWGKETGFMGMRMNGNLALEGKVMMFSCDGSHPRC